MSALIGKPGLLSPDASNGRREPSYLNTRFVPVHLMSTRLGAAPRIIGNYALFDEIAAGGMGAVHLGRQLGFSGFERVVAVKRAHSSMAYDADFVAMFREEIRLLSRIRHQNVVPALDVVEDCGELLLVMEYVHGQPLSVLARQARESELAIPLEICVAIACGVLHGLHAVHTARSATDEPLCIVHRDVSPQNVLVGCDGLARVLDFGVAKADSSADVTRVGHVKGKLGYIAPEHLLGRPSDSRGDLYGLAVVLWEMLAGVRLFGGGDAEVVESVISGRVLKFSAVTSRHVPGALEDVVRRGLATNPAERFASAHDMALALQGAVTTASAQEVGDWVTEAAHESLVNLSRQLAWAENCPLPHASHERAPLEAALVQAPVASDELDDKNLVDDPVTRMMPLSTTMPLSTAMPLSAATPLSTTSTSAVEQAAGTAPSRRARRQAEPVRRGFLYPAALAVAVVAANLVTHGALAACLRQYVTPALALAHAASPADSAGAPALRLASVTAPSQPVIAEPPLQEAALPPVAIPVASLPLAAPNRAPSANRPPRPSSKSAPVASSARVASLGDAPLPSHAAIPVHVRKPATSNPVARDGF